MVHHRADRPAVEGHDGHAERLDASKAGSFLKSAHFFGRRAHSLVLVETSLFGFWCDTFPAIRVLRMWCVGIEKNL